MNNKNYLIGIDGGGTKTITALATEKGKVLKIAKTGPSSPRNIKIETAVSNIEKGIKRVFKKGNIKSVFIGLAAIEEQPDLRIKIKKEIKKRKWLFSILKGKFEIGSDQITAFRSATLKKDGILIISGTGCVVHGWKGSKEHKTSGWGYFADEGSAFWAGQKAFQSALKDLDKRGSKTEITKMIFRKLKVKNIEQFLNKVYSKDSNEIVPLFSILVDKASKKGDKISKQIMNQAAGELILAAKTVIKELKFENKKFPLVLSGSMFKSEIILGKVKKEIKKIAPKVEFIRPKKEPVIGAVSLAKEMAKNRFNLWRY